MLDAEIAIAASPRDWAQRLHRYVADHGGARVRATVLHPHDALRERYDVLVADDTTSFLTRHLLAQLHRGGRRVLGVYDPDDPRGRSDLVELGADLTIARGEPAQEFVRLIGELALAARLLRAEAEGAAPGGGAEAAADPEPQRPAPRGRVLAVSGVSGGTGATEVAVGLASAAARSGGCVLVDADDIGPSIAQRLGLPLYPNLRAAVDAVEHHSGALTDAVVRLPGGPGVLVGLSRPAEWMELRPIETVDVVKALAAQAALVVVNVAPRLEDLPAAGAPARYAQARAVVAEADLVVGVGTASPVGVTRALEWVADVRAIAASTPVHLVVNQAPAGPYRRREVAGEIERSYTPASLSFLPYDERVRAASWTGQLVRRGPFAKALQRAAGRILAPAAELRSAGPDDRAEGTSRRPWRRGGRPRRLGGAVPAPVAARGGVGA